MHRLVYAAPVRGYVLAAAEPTSFGIGVAVLG